MSSPAATLAPPAFVQSSRDRATIVVAAFALAALALAPWAAGGAASALIRAFSGATSLWPLIAASVAVPLLFGAVGSSLGLAPVFWSVGLSLATGGYLTRRRTRS